jgi:hypothetical protein
MACTVDGEERKSRKEAQLGEKFCLIYLFTSLLYMFRASTCPASGELLHLGNTVICHSVWVATGLLVGLKLHFQSNQQTRRHTHTE